MFNDGPKVKFCCQIIVSIPLRMDRDFSVLNLVLKKLHISRFKPVNDLFELIRLGPLTQ